MSRTTIETHPSGTYFDFENPRAEDVRVEDIARSLSMQCRFGGHVSLFYSVAEHACLVARLVREAGHSPELEFAALHHDSHEAYVGDIPTPLKQWFPELEDLVYDIDEAISDALGLGFQPHDAIKDADLQALAIEAFRLKVSQGRGDHWVRMPTVTEADIPHGAVACWDSQWAEHMFLMNHYRLSSALALKRIGL